MKKIFYYLGAGVIILGLIGFWLYSFLYGSPNNATPQFANFDLFGNETVVPEVVPPVTIAPPVVDVALAKLRQLTTKPVIGMRIIVRGNNLLMRYVEAGTGQVFDISLKNGMETRVSPISIPVASEAIISDSGEYIAVRSSEQSGNEVVLIHIRESGTPSKETISASVTNFEFGTNNIFYYGTLVGATLEGRSYNLTTQETKRLFTVPFTAATILWSRQASASHYVLTKSAASLTSHLYEVRGANIIRTPISGRGLTVLPYQQSILFSIVEATGQVKLFNYSLVQKNTQLQIIPALADKCISELRGTNLYCAANLDTRDANLPDSWYKGLVSFDDRIWKIDKLGINSQIANPSTISGRPLDLNKIKITNDGRMLYFVNKIDQSLWVYEL